jgi:hypothetical protein
MRIILVCNSQLVILFNHRLLFIITELFTSIVTHRSKIYMPVAWLRNRNEGSYHNVDMQFVFRDKKYKENFVEEISS